MSIDASVIICAYTEARWEELRAAVSSVQQQDAAPREIIVVIDHNPQLCQRAQAEIPGVVLLENEETRGLSGARNTGVKAARGSLIAFLDDDAVAEPDWLELLARPCDDPLTMGCGGLIEPAWQTGKPSWFPDEFNWVVGCSYRGLPWTLSPIRNLIGSSMCIRREVFEAAGYFRSDVGRVDKHPVGCEETELCIRAQQRWPGRRFLYEPAARIHHVVPASRARWSYFCARCFFEGRSKAQVARVAGARDGLSSERLYTLSVLPRGVLRNLAQGLAHRDISGLARAGAIMAGLAITTWGYVTGAWRQRWERPKVWLRRSVAAVFPTAMPDRIYSARIRHQESD